MALAFEERLREKVISSERAWSELQQRAAQARESGDWQAYWLLRWPSFLPDLYFLLGENEKAQQGYLEAVGYFRELRQWLAEHGQTWKPRYEEARVCFMASLWPEARSCLAEVIAAVGSPADTLLGIMLIQAGDPEGGRALLQRRAAMLAEEERLDAAQLFHLGETLFWLEDLAAAEEGIVVALSRWKGPADAPPRGLYYLVRYARSQEPDAAEEARQALREAVAWYYDAGLIGQAISALEYSRWLEHWPQKYAGLKIQGMSYLWSEDL